MPQLYRQPRRQGDRTIQGINQRPKSVYRGPEYIREFNSPIISPASQASSIEEDNHISYGSYIPNHYSPSFSADTVKTMETFEKPADNETNGTNISTETFFSKRLQQLTEFSKLHNVKYEKEEEEEEEEEDVVSRNSSVSVISNNNSQSPVTSKESNSVINQTDKLPTVLRKDFVDNVYTMAVLSKKSEDGKDDGKDDGKTIRENIIKSLSTTPASPESSATLQKSPALQESPPAISSATLSQVSLDETIASILSSSASQAPQSSQSPLEKAISIASSIPSESIKSIEHDDITWNNNAKNWTLLHVAVINQKKDDVIALLQSKNSDNLLFNQDIDGLTPLHWAVLKSDTVTGDDIIRELLKYISETNKENVTGQIEILNRQDNDGNTAFKWAIKQSKSAIAKEIIAHMLILSKIKQEKKSKENVEEIFIPGQGESLIFSQSKENVEEIFIPKQGESLIFSQPKQSANSILPILFNNTSSSFVEPQSGSVRFTSGSQLDNIDLYNIEHSAPKTTILHLIASAMTVPNKPVHAATVSTAASTTPASIANASTATVSTAASTTPASIANASIANASTANASTAVPTELSESTVYSLIQTNPSFIITPDESGLTPLHIVSRNIFSQVSTFTISNVSLANKSNNNAVSLPSTISSNNNVSNTNTNNNSNASTPSTISSNNNNNVSNDSVLRTTSFVSIPPPSATENIPNTNTNNNSNASTPSTISSNVSFEQSIILLQNMIDTIMPVDSSPDYLSSLTLSASSFKDDQGNNPLHELVTSFWKSRLSSISALTQTMNIIEDIRKQSQSSSTNSTTDNSVGLTFPIISVPALIPLQYIIKNDSSPDPDVAESIQSQPTRKSILFFNKDKTQPLTVTLFNSSEKSIPLSADTLTKDSEIYEQFARDFFTPQTSDYSSAEEIFKTLMETKDGLVELPFAEFKNQTNDQGFYPIDTFVDFMTTYERYLVDNFKFETAGERLENLQDTEKEIVLRLNKTAHGKMQGLTNILLLLTPDDEVLKETDTPDDGMKSGVTRDGDVANAESSDNIINSNPNQAELAEVNTQVATMSKLISATYKTKKITFTKMMDDIIELTILIPEKNIAGIGSNGPPVASNNGDIVYVISGSFNNNDVPQLTVEQTIITDTISEFKDYNISIDLSTIINGNMTNQIINKDSSLLRMIELLLSPSSVANNDEYKILQPDIIEGLKKKITEKITEKISDISQQYEFKLTFQKKNENDSLALKLFIRIN